MFNKDYFNDSDNISIISTSDIKEKEYSFTHIFPEHQYLIDYSNKIKEINNDSNLYLDEYEKNESIQRCMKNIFEVKDDLSEMNNLENSLSENNSLNSYGNNNFLGLKTIRKNSGNEQEVIDKENEKKIFMIKKDYILYRHDYYIMAFKGDFLNYVKKKLNKLVENINFCKKFGKIKFHTPNRKLYGGNTKEEDNREFIEKTIEEVFTDQIISEDENDSSNGCSRQQDNESMINRVKKLKESLSSKLKNDEKYKKQFNEIDNLLKYLNNKIKYVLDEYYDSEEFGDFRSQRKIRYYDRKFYSERNRNFSLLEKNNFIKLVNLPYYSDKKEYKK